MKDDLKDTTFLLLVRLDTIERLENTLVTINYLITNFNTNIKVLEVAPYCSGLLKKMLHRKVEYGFKEDCDPILFRTRYLNDMIRSVTTPYVSVWDVDVIAPASQIIESVELLRSDKADFVYPYESKLLDTSPILRNLYIKTKRLSLFCKNIYKMREMHPPKSVGGAFICKLDCFIKVGLENEKFYGWGVEDGERYNRWKKNGYIIKRANGVMFHLSHPRGVNSVMHNQDQKHIKLRMWEDSNRQGLLE